MRPFSALLRHPEYWAVRRENVARAFAIPPFFPFPTRELARALGTAGIVLLTAGGIIYSAGALIYALRRPDPFPKVFGYHEVFHVLVIVAAVFHYAAVMGVVGAL